MTRLEVLYRKIKGDFAFSVRIDAPRRMKIAGKTKVLPFAHIDARHGNIEIGSRCYIDRYVIISSHGGDISIGDHCSFNPFCVIYGHGGLKIGNDVRIAAGTIIIPANHGFKLREKKICEQPVEAKGIVIGNDCWLGSGVKVLDGVIIEDGCVIGAGSVVTKSFESFSIIAGNPARVIGQR